MKPKTIEAVMSVLLLIAVYITISYGLPLTHITANNKNASASEQKTQSEDGVRKVVIDSGHGGIDGGKVGRSGVLEKEINLSIANKLKDLLEADGIQVVMTRTDDNGLYKENDGNKKVADLKKRCEIINSSKADLVISIHQNSFPDPDVSGAQTFYYTYSAEGKKLAGILQNSLKTYLNTKNTRVETSNKTYYMLINTKIPTIIVECGFLSNPNEEELLKSDEYQESIAKALYNGIVTYLTE